MNEDFVNQATTILSKCIKNSAGAVMSKHKKNQRLDAIFNKNIIFLKSGSVTLYRMDNNKINATLHAPAILGLTQLYSDEKHHYLRCDTPCELWSIDTQDAITMFKEKNLWEYTFLILSWHLHSYFRREKIISLPNVRTVIYEHLKYIWSMKPDARQKTSIYSFIMSRNHISRSMIHKTVTDLIRAGNVQIQRGRLTYYQEDIPTQKH